VTGDVSTKHTYTVPEVLALFDVGTLVRFGDRLARITACVWCAASYVGKRADSRYCSPSCRSAARRARARRDLSARSCSWCSSDLPTSSRADSRYCGTRCRVAAHRARARAGNDSEHGSDRVQVTGDGHVWVERALW
jgi:hypothetical protein